MLICWVNNLFQSTMKIYNQDLTRFNKKGEPAQKSTFPPVLLALRIVLCTSRSPSSSDDSRFCINSH